MDAICFEKAGSFSKQKKTPSYNNAKLAAPETVSSFLSSHLANVKVSGVNRLGLFLALWFHRNISEGVKQCVVLKLSVLSDPHFCINIKPGI